jgi:4-diphosphocytidyl-2-C-methyl-D-erythritol kinase
MIEFPCAKLNLGLRVLNKRDDGYHNIESLIVAVGMCDVLEVVRTDNKADRFIMSGIDVDCVDDDNLCIRALRLLRNDYEIPPVSIYLHKNIPTGAGLGGGSSDAASMLKILNQEFSINIPKYKLIEYSLLIGSDCPFFLDDKPMLVRGRGDILLPFEIDLKGIFIVVVKPSVSVNTGLAYANIEELRVTTIFEEIIKSRNIWQSQLTNSFESYIFKLYPEVEEIKRKLYESGAFFALMSGSGSSVYGLFNKKVSVNKLFPSFFTWEGQFKI